ncbi:MAG: DUF4157 domain-containing protein [Faecalibacterium sp.]
MQEYVQQRKRPGTLPPSFRGAETARSVPNSARLAASETQASPYSDALREKFARHQIPSAEREADRLSQGLTAQTPEQVRQQLGERLGADFSGVRFHTDAASAGRAESIGARAFATGRDVYFGQGGFDAGVAAHELVHTVQQGVVPAAVPTVSAPVGEVQMMPKWMAKVYDSTFGSLGRSRKRAREDYIRNKASGDWDQLSWFKKARFTLANPFAVLGAKRRGIDKEITRLQDTNRWDNEEEWARKYAAQRAANAPPIQTAHDLEREIPQDSMLRDTVDFVAENISSEEGELTDQLVSQFAKSDEQKHSILEQVGKGKEIYTFGTGLLSGTRALGNTARAFKAVGESGKSGITGSTMEALTDALTTPLEGASNVLGVVKAGMNLFGGAGKGDSLDLLGGTKGFGGTALGKMMGAGEEGLGIGNILDTAAAGLNLVKNTAKLLSNTDIRRRSGNVQKQFQAGYNALLAPNAPLEDESAMDDAEKHTKKMYQSAFLGNRNAKANQIGAGMDILDNAIGVGKNFAPPLVSQGIGVGQKFLGWLKNKFVSKTKKNTNIQLLNEEMGLDQEITAQAKKMLEKKRQQQNPKAVLGTQDELWDQTGELEKLQVLRKAKHAVLMGRGFKSGKRSEAAGRLRLDRAEYLKQTAEDPTDQAQSKQAQTLLKALHVHRVKDDQGNKEYNVDDISTQLGLEGGAEGLQNIQNSRGSKIQYLKKRRFRDSLKSFFFGKG